MPKKFINVFRDCTRGKLDPTEAPRLLRATLVCNLLYFLKLAPKQNQETRVKGLKWTKNPKKPTGH